MRSSLWDKNRNILLLLGSLAWLASIEPVLADDKDLLKLTIGVNLQNMNTEVNIGSSNGGNNGQIDLEDDLGLASDVRAFWISGMYRVGDNHRLNLIYFPVDRTSVRQLNKDIVVDNTTIKAGALVTWKSGIDILDLDYTYSAYKNPNLEIGLTVGVYWMFSNVDVLAAGEVIAAGDNIPVFKIDFRSEQNLSAPLPLFGVRADYKISNSWRIQGAVRYFGVTVNDFEGEILSVGFGAEYYFTPNWALGASLAAFSLDVEVSGVVLTNSLGWSDKGLQLYGVYRY